LRSINHAGLEPYISTPRLDTYRTFFSPSNDIELLGCYLWNKEVAAAFFPLLQVLEITLRNAIHKEAHQALGAFWFDNIATRPSGSLSTSQQRVVRQCHNSIKNARDQIRRDLRLSPSATVLEDRIVAKVTFGFWTNLFNAAFDVNRNTQALWPALLRSVFPNAPKRARDRSIIQGKLIAIKGFRNKAFHHEPVWNIGQPASIADAMLKLLDTKELILEVIRWMSVEGEELVRKAGYVNTIERICSVGHLEYLKHPGSNDIPISRAKRELRGLLRASNGKSTVDITRNGNRVGKLLHHN